MLQLRADEINNASEAPSGDTLLIRAAQNGRLATSITLLTMGGADCDIPRNDGATALLCASLQGHGAVVAALITAGAEIDKTCNDGDTPLVFASLRGHKAVVAALITAGAEIDKANNAGDTPLIGASVNQAETTPDSARLWRNNPCLSSPNQAETTPASVLGFRPKSRSRPSSQGLTERAFGSSASKVRSVGGWMSWACWMWREALRTHAPLARVSSAGMRTLIRFRGYGPAPWMFLAILVFYNQNGSARVRTCSLADIDTSTNSLPASDACVAGYPIWSEATVSQSQIHPGQMRLSNHKNGAQLLIMLVDFEQAAADAAQAAAQAAEAAPGGNGVDGDKGEGGEGNEGEEGEPEEQAHFDDGYEDDDYDDDPAVTLNDKMLSAMRKLESAIQNKKLLTRKRPKPMGEEDKREDDSPPDEPSKFKARRDDPDDGAGGAGMGLSYS